MFTPTSASSYSSPGFPARPLTPTISTMADLLDLQEQICSMAVVMGADWLQDQVAAFLGASATAP